MRLKWPWWALIGLFVILLIHTWTGPDIWYHLFLGERVWHTGLAEPGDNLLFRQPECINAYWFFQLIARGIYALAGVPGVSVFFLLLWAGAAWFWLKVVRPMGHGGLGALLTLMALLIIQRRFEPRPEIVSYLILSYQVYWWWSWQPEERLNPKRVALLLLSEVVLTNSHGYLVLGPAIAGLRGVCLILEGRIVQLKSLVMLMAGVLLASLVSPLGIDPWVGAFAHAHALGALKYSIKEFHPPSMRYPQDLVFWVTWVLTIVGVLFLLIKKRARGWFAPGLALVGIALSHQALRNFPLFVIFSAPAWAVLLSEIRLSARVQRWSESGAGVGAIALALSVISGAFYASTMSPNAFGWGVSQQMYPHRFSAYLREHPVAGVIFNDPNFGGFLEFHHQKQPFYADSRYCNAPRVQEFFTALVNPDVFKELDQQHKFSGVILDISPSREMVIYLLSRESGWTLQFADIQNAFFTRDAKGAKDLHFYRGENLYRIPYQHYATQWVSNIGMADRRDLMEIALKQFAETQAVPPSVITAALQYVMPKADVELLKLVVALRARMSPVTGQDAAYVDQLLAQTPAGR